jgi:hypothetical protein
MLDIGNLVQQYGYIGIFLLLIRDSISSFQTPYDARTGS